MSKREKNRDNREFDTTQLHETGHGRSLHRDYSAHFFRWSFARRFITINDNVLEVGCGEDKPLSKILTGGACAHVNKYVGVDLNKLKPSGSQRLTFIGEFNFIERYAELKDHSPEGYDVLVSLEVIEHMKLEHGVKFLWACRKMLKFGGRLILSTPCYDGVRHAANHIHEYTVPELKELIERSGFKVIDRFGTFMDIKHIGKDDLEVLKFKKKLSTYYDNDAISCFFAPLYPDHSRNNLWVCEAI